MKYRNIIVWFFLFFVAVLAVMLAATNKIYWSTRYYDLEIKIRFIDEMGKGIKGVTLRVVDSAGADSPCFPISDYTNISTPVSSDNGLLIFHHVGNELVFSGVTTSSPVWGTNVKKSKQLIPDYLCKYYLGNNCLKSETFHELHTRAVSQCGDRPLTELPTIRREWEWDGDCFSLLDSDRIPAQMPRMRSTTVNFVVFEETIIVELPR